MSDFIKYSKIIDETINKFINKYTEMVNAGIFVKNDDFFLEFINEIKNVYKKNKIPEEESSFKIIEIINDFSTKNKELLLKNYCNDMENIIPINIEEFNSIPTKIDFDLLNEDLIKSDEQNDKDIIKSDEDYDKNIISSEVNLEYNDVDKVYAVLSGIRQFIKNDNIDYKNLIIYIIRFSILRKIAIKNMNPEEVKNNCLDVINEKYLTDQFLKTLDQTNLDKISKNTTHYMLRYFREYS